VLLGLLEVQRVGLVDCRHRHASMHGAEDLGLDRGVEAVRKAAQPLIQALPELHPAGDRQRSRDRAEAGDVLMADLAVFPAGLNQAELQPARRLTEADEHV
jgi:hypothetical protein